MRIADFDYPFDPSLIAQHPAAVRDQSRLLFYDCSNPKPVHTSFSALPGCLRPGDLLVFNNTRVIPARLRGQKPTGGKVELLLLRKEGPGLWEALVGGATRVGTRVLFRGGSEARVVEVLHQGRRRVEFSSTDDRWMWREGQIPLPPYIRRENGPRPEDSERYQTIFAKVDGSVAAPTAGLHFSRTLLDALRASGIAIAELTLHVGLATFSPIRTERVADHRMGAERYEIPPETISAILKTKAAGGRVVAVGTTTTRALESAFEGGSPSRLEGETTLFIRPGHPFAAVDGLVTNFHLPRSTLLILVAAFLGRETMLSLYGEAVRERYRFYSFGDGMLILR